MSDWASPILVIPKKEEQAENSSDQNTTTSANENKFNLRLCIDYRKVNSCIITARQIKGDGSLGKVIFNYSFPTIGNLLVNVLI